MQASQTPHLCTTTVEPTFEAVVRDWKERCDYTQRVIAALDVARSFQYTLEISEQVALVNLSAPQKSACQVVASCCFCKRSCEISRWCILSITGNGEWSYPLCPLDVTSQFSCFKLCLRQVDDNSHLRSTGRGMP